MIDYTTPALIADALGPSAAPDVDDDYLVRCAAAANAWTARKRREAGYVDEAVPPDPPIPIGADLTFGATLYGVALWRERASADSFPSFEEMAAYAPTGGTLGQIKRLLGIGRAAVDTPRPGLVGGGAVVAVPTADRADRGPALSNLNDERVEIAGKLAAAGVETVTLDPATSAPFVLVGPPRSNGAGAGIGGWAVRYPVVVAAAPPGDAAALSWQLDQVELVLRTLGPSDDWSPGTYDPAGKNLPAYTLTYPRDVANPDC